MGIDDTHGTRSRALGRRAGTTTTLLAGAIAAGALALVLGLRVRTVLQDGAGPWRVDAVVELGVTALGCVVALWLACSALVATACLVVRAGGATWRAGERLVQQFAPQLVRRAMVLAVGASIGLGAATGASAAVPEPAPTVAASVAATVEGGSLDLGWVVTSAPTDAAEPTAPVGGTPEPAPAAVRTPSPPEVAPADPDTAPAPDVPVLTAAPTPAAAPTSAATGPAAPASTATGSAAQAPASPGTVVVADGDTLWAIAARHLPPGAGDAEIAAAWPRWYEANAPLIGPDPDVIVPGQVLAVPAATDGMSR